MGSVFEGFIVSDEGGVHENVCWEDKYEGVILLQDGRRSGPLLHLYSWLSGTQGTGPGQSWQAHGSSGGEARSREKLLELRLGT